MAKKFSSLLVQDKIVPIQKMEEALQRQVIFGGRLGTNLLEMGVITENELMRYLTTTQSLESASDDQYTNIDPDALQLLEVEAIERINLLPVRINSGKKVDVFVIDPVDSKIIDSLSKMTGYTFVQYIIPEFRFLQALNLFFGRQLPRRFERLLNRFPLPMQTGTPSILGEPGTETGLLEQARSTSSHTGRQFGPAPGSLPESPVKASPLLSPMAIAGNAPSLSTSKVAATRDVQLGLGWSREEVSDFLRDCYSRDVSLELLLGFAGNFAQRRALLVVAKQKVQGYLSAGFRDSENTIRQFKAPIIPEGLLAQVCQGEECYQGDPEGVCLEKLYTNFELTPPEQVVMIPIRVGPRAGLLLLLDDNNLMIEVGTLTPLFRIVNETSSALERIIKLMKRGELPPRELRIPPPPSRYQHNQEPGRKPPSVARRSLATREDLLAARLQASTSSTPSSEGQPTVPLQPEASDPARNQYRAQPEAPDRPQSPHTERQDPKVAETEASVETEAVADTEASASSEATAPEPIEALPETLAKEDTVSKTAALEKAIGALKSIAATSTSKSKKPTTQPSEPEPDTSVASAEDPQLSEPEPEVLPATDTHEEAAPEATDDTVATPPPEEEPEPVVVEAPDTSDDQNKKVPVLVKASGPAPALSEPKPVSGVQVPTEVKRTFLPLMIDSSPSMVPRTPPSLAFDDAELDLAFSTDLEDSEDSTELHKISGDLSSVLGSNPSLAGWNLPDSFGASSTSLKAKPQAPSEAEEAEDAEEEAEIESEVEAKPETEVKAETKAPEPAQEAPKPAPEASPASEQPRQLSHHEQTLFASDLKARLSTIDDSLLRPSTRYNLNRVRRLAAKLHANLADNNINNAVDNAKTLLSILPKPEQGIDFQDVRGFLTDLIEAPKNPNTASSVEINVAKRPKKTQKFPVAKATIVLPALASTPEYQAALREEEESKTEASPAQPAEDKTLSQETAAPEPENAASLEESETSSIDEHVQKAFAEPTPPAADIPDVEIPEPEPAPEPIEVAELEPVQDLAPALEDIPDFDIPEIDLPELDIPEPEPVEVAKPEPEPAEAVVVDNANASEQVNTTAPVVLDAAPDEIPAVLLDAIAVPQEPKASAPESAPSLFELGGPDAPAIETPIAKPPPVLELGGPDAPAIETPPSSAVLEPGGSAVPGIELLFQKSPEVLELGGPDAPLVNSPASSPVLELGGPDAPAIDAPSAPAVFELGGPDAPLVKSPDSSPVLELGGPDAPAIKPSKPSAVLEPGGTAVPGIELLVDAAPIVLEAAPPVLELGGPEAPAIDAAPAEPPPMLELGGPEAPAIEPENAASLEESETSSIDEHVQKAFAEPAPASIDIPKFEIPEPEPEPEPEPIEVAELEPVQDLAPALEDIPDFDIPEIDLPELDLPGPEPVEVKAPEPEPVEILELELEPVDAPIVASGTSDAQATPQDNTETATVMLDAIAPEITEAPVVKIDSVATEATPEPQDSAPESDDNADALEIELEAVEDAIPADVADEKPDIQIEESQTEPENEPNNQFAFVDDEEINPALAEMGERVNFGGAGASEDEEELDATSSHEPGFTVSSPGTNEEEFPSLFESIENPPSTPRLTPDGHIKPPPPSQPIKALIPESPLENLESTKLPPPNLGEAKKPVEPAPEGSLIDAGLLQLVEEDEKPDSDEPPSIDMSDRPLIDTGTIELEALPSIDEDDSIDLGQDEEIIFDPDTTAALNRYRPHVEKLFGKDPTATSAATTILLDSGGMALPALLERFPGPIRLDHYSYAVSKLPPIEQHGPLLSILVQLGDLAAPAMSSFFDHHSVEIRFYSTFYFTKIRYEPMLPQMLKRLFDRDSQIRSIARSIVRTYRGTNNYREVLRQVYQILGSSQDTWMLEQASLAIGSLAEIRAVPQLIDMVESPHHRVSDSVHKALCQITFEDFGKNKRKWTRWWRDHSNDERNMWLIGALNHNKPRIRELAAEELHHMPGLLVNYSPYGPKPQRIRAQKIVAQYLRDSSYSSL